MNALEIFKVYAELIKEMQNLMPFFLIPPQIWKPNPLFTA